LDQGWTVSGNATSGAWERGDPIGVNIYGIQVTPPSDDPTDIGTTCYVTGNNSDLVAGRVSGTTTLTSPVFDATIMVEPIVNYLPWFLSATQQGGATSSRLRVFLNDGTNQVMIEELDFTFGQTQNWRNTSSIKISDFITPTSTMNIIFETEDLTNSNITEAGVDFFVLTEAASSVVTAEDAGILINVSPNPASDQFNLVYDVIEHPDPLTIRIYNALGQSKEEFIITDHSGEFSFGKQFSSGVYFIQIRSKNQTFKAMKVIKTE